MMDTIVILALTFTYLTISFVGILFIVLLIEFVPLTYIAIFIFSVFWGFITTQTFIYLIKNFKKGE